MSFYRYKETGEVIRNRISTTCEEETLTEQSHVDEVDVNKIIKKHGMDVIAKTRELMADNFRMDEIPTNDFHEALMIIQKASKTFTSLPSSVRKRFDNEPSKFLDFVQNPANNQAMVDMGLAVDITPAEPQPVPVVIQETTTTTSETPTE